ncbi:penicillin-binding protein 1A [Desulfuromonas thiophila]|uniref:penicillin-binding protein 1A n=1 Tax=Desulfuromonas thiophila TaxID=57664 RepID=UPI0024A88BC6|nr:PBP1A family penicillin-binding protein [Desulfuromonas thiophila]
MFWVKKIFWWLFYLTAAGTLVGLTALLTAYVLVLETLPQMDRLEDYQPPVITRIYSNDGTPIAEFYRERRIIVPVSQMPQALIEAFVSAEDANFFEHQGVDLVSIGRAALRNLQAGGIVQGGSTITQQVAKSLLLTPERKFSRKFKEAILAWRIEQRFSKTEILHLYLNQIYLGHGAYGVQAAAENYFAKDIKDLSLAECALLAGLPQAPSRYSPYHNLTGARERQRYVLQRMVNEGFITSEQADQARNEELTIHARNQNFLKETGYFTEQVRRYLEQTYGSDQLYTAGLQVYTSLDLAKQQAAHQAVRANLREYQRRHGFPMPSRIIRPTEQEDFLSHQALQALQPQAELEVLVTDRDQQGLHIRYGAAQGLIPQDRIKWLEPFQLVDNATETPGEITRKIPRGALVHIRVIQQDRQPFLADLLPEPQAQGALVALEPDTGFVLAMVGGYDFTDSQFNRVTQAKRLPGSAIKPLIYAAALDRGFTAASVVIDSPVIYNRTSSDGRRERWQPKNYNNRFAGPTSLRQALTQSNNVVTVKLLEEIGVGYTLTYLKKLGIKSPLNRDLTLALGSSALTPLELATAYTVFANGGIRIEPSYIQRVLDREGRIIESIDPADFPSGLLANQRLVKPRRQRVISEETAYLITNMLESVVEEGTGIRARSLKRPSAGKTGTTNQLKDAWYVGYIPQMVAVSWVGYDKEKPLGPQETGAKAAAPAWINFMAEACKSWPVEEFKIPDRIEFHPIDRTSGLLTAEDQPNSFIEVFAPGTAPQRYASDNRQPQAKDFFRWE